jgi:biopolymer transport protein ExbD
MHKRLTRPKSEPTIALINIVFLMLIFFMVAGTLAPKMDADLNLANTQDLEGAPPPDALVIHSDGNLSFRGIEVNDPAAYFETLNDITIAKIVPDRAAPAQALLEAAQYLRSAGVERVMIVTEKALR